MLRYLRFLLSMGAARGAATLISAATLPFLVRVVGVDGFGRWNYVLAVIGFFDLLVNPGLIAHAAREAAAHRASANPMVSEVFTLRVLLGAAASLILTSYALVVETDHSVQVLLMLYGIPFLLLGAVQSAYLLSSNKYFHWASMRRAYQCSYALGVFSCIRSAADLPLLAAITLASIALSAAVGWIKLAALGFGLHWVWRPRAFVELLKQSAPFGVASLGSQLYTRSGHIIVRC